MSTAFYKKYLNDNNKLKQKISSVKTKSIYKNKTMKTLCDADSFAVLIVRNDICTFKIIVKYYMYTMMLKAI